MKVDVAIVGGGIVGLATADAFQEAYPARRIAVLEKEASWARHQTGHNSGVIHSGIYYKPGTLKARLARDGNRAMVEFSRAHHLPVEVCGKLIAATTATELPRLAQLQERAIANGISVTRLSAEAACEIEPHLNCLEALYVPDTGLADYVAVCATLVKKIESRNGQLLLGHHVTHVERLGEGYRLRTPQNTVDCDFLITCGGLQSDRLAQTAGVDPGARIVPFRGEYYELRPEKRSLVRNLIYPVPDPLFPFLGVHFTRMIDGSIHAGPNAVLSFKREAYTGWAFNARDTWEMIRYAGFWKMAARFPKPGLAEFRRSLSKRAFTAALQRLIPEIQPDDLIPSASGVRAQMVWPDGTLVDDFHLVWGPRALHVCNAPSPAATASLAIARHIVQEWHKIYS